MFMNDRIISISKASNRQSANWQLQQLSISDFYETLRIPWRSPETMAEFLAMKKSQQDNLKDVGGFLAGTLSGNRRKADNVTGRDIITLDFDNIPPGATQDIIQRVNGLGCGYCVHSTRKHTPANPRLRILIPLNRTATPDEYEPVARYVASLIGLKFADPTTFDVSRLMYYPSICSDGKYVFNYADKGLVDIDELLKAINERFGNWHDVSKWLQVPGRETRFQKPATKQANPLTKSGTVGAFCRAYNIYEAMEKFLPGVYEPIDTMPNRFTYTGGSTTGGAVVYDNGLFLYSYHATDPCSAKLVNAFDLVRLHKFAKLDDDAKNGTPEGKLPSYSAMCEFAIKDEKVLAQLASDRAKSAITDFSGLSESQLANSDWFSKLERHAKTGLPKSTINNVSIILENDPNLAGKFALNECSGRYEVLSDVPWEKINMPRNWKDNDNHGLYWYLETSPAYQISSNSKIDSALSIVCERHKYNPVADYLMSLIWDEQPRIETLLIDYLGAIDTPYIRAVTRKTLIAAVARAMTPGCKFDQMLILSGPQGIGKSTLLQKMGRGWFTDNVYTFEGKEASELIMGRWIVEIGELNAFRRTQDVARIKGFTSMLVDSFRQAYGKNVEDFPRRCVFIGTTNTRDYLQDPTGNRRFWPVDVGVTNHEKNVWDDLDDAIIDQLWAEACVYWNSNEPLYLSQNLAKIAQQEQEGHRETSSKEGLIIEFLDKPIPDNWNSWKLDARRSYWDGTTEAKDRVLVRRTKVCILEIWCEVFYGTPKELKKPEANEIRSIIQSLPNWEWSPSVWRSKPYGVQRGYTRTV